MDPFAAKIIFGIIFFVASGVWLISLKMALRIGRTATPTVDPFAPFDASQQNMPADDCEINGERTIRGVSDSVSQSIAQNLVSMGVPGMFTSLFEVEERTAERISIRKTGPLVCNQPTGMYFSEVEFTLRPEGSDHVLVSYRIGFERLIQKLRRVALLLIFCVGLPVIISGGLALWFGVVQHQNPAVRWQVFQGLQAVHVLWPPFLIMYFYRTGRTHARTYISNVLATVDAVGPSSTINA